MLPKPVMLPGFCRSSSSMWQVNQLTHQHLAPISAQCNATDAKQWDTKHSIAKTHKFVAGVPRKGTITEIALMLSQSVYCVEVLMNPTVRTAESYIHVLMSRVFQILQLNVGK